MFSLPCQASLQRDEVKTDVVRLVRDRGRDDGLKALAVYTAAVWTNTHPRRPSDGTLAASFSKRMSAS